MPIEEFEDVREGFEQWSNLFSTTNPSDISDQEIMSLESELRETYAISKSARWRQRELIREAFVIASFLSNKIKSGEREGLELLFFDKLVALGDLLEILGNS